MKQPLDVRRPRMSPDTHGAALTAGSGLKQPYHLVDPSPWPLVGALGGGLTVLGIIFAAHYGNYILLALGLAIVLGMMFVWWRDVLRESRTPGCTRRWCGSACATAWCCSSPAR